MSSENVEKAVAYFDNGFCCSQAVFTTFAIEYGIPEELERCRELGVFNTICPEMVRCAAEIVEQMLAEEK